MNFDLQTLKAKMDCREFAAAFTTLKAKSDKELTGACPVCGGEDRFNVQADKWLCRTCTEGRYRDIISLAAHMWGLNTKDDFKLICERLEAPVVLSGRTTNNRQPAPEPDNDNPPPADWQKPVRGLVLHFHELLYSSEGRSALDWLHGRGLLDTTIRYFQIGYNPKSQNLAGHWIYNGITIPHYQLDTGTMWAVKIRLGAEGRQTWTRIQRQKNSDKDPGEPPKYIGIRGWKQNLFHADTLLNNQAAFICEGEFDTMLLWQQAGDLAGAVTLGSCTAHLGQRWLPLLLPIRRFYLALDNDQPGRMGRKYWADLLGKRGILADVPNGKDITEYHLAGGDLREWVIGLELERAF